MARLDKATKKQIIGSIKSGMSASEVAKEFDITVSGVYYIMKKNGVKASAPRAKKEASLEEDDTSEEEVVSEDTWEKRAQYWLTKYMEAHVELLELKDKYQA